MNNKNPFRSISRFFLGACVLLTALGTRAVSGAEADIAGQWQSRTLSAPKDMFFDGNELFGGNDFKIGGETIDYIIADGAYEYYNQTNLDDYGLYSLSPGLLVIHQTSNGEQVRYMNKTLDIMVTAASGVKRPEEDVKTGLSFLLRSPGTFSIADLSGAWDCRSIEIPKSVSAPNVAPGSLLTGGDAFGAERLEMAAIDGNGNLSHESRDSAIGVFVLQDGQLKLNRGGQSEPCIINAGLDLIVVTGEDTATDAGYPTYHLTLLVRRAEVVTEQDIVGRWNVSNMETPGLLKVATDGESLFVDGTSHFRDENFPVTFKPGGVAVNDFLQAEFPWQLQPDGLVKVWTLTGELLLAVNRSKSFAVAVRNDEGGDKQMLLAVKYSDAYAPPAPTLSFQRNGSEWHIVWTHGILERATSVTGPWNAIDNAVSPYVMATRETGEFFRVRSAANP